MLPSLVEGGVHRIECRSFMGRNDTHKWLTSLGAYPEAVLAAFGRQREDFVLYAWLADDIKPPSKPH
jgi:hypothetical protein